MKLLSLVGIFLLLFLSLSCRTQPAEQAVNNPILTESLGSLSPLSPQASEERNPLLISTDHGQSWQVAPNDLPLDLEVSFLEKKGSEMVMATDNQGIFLSSNQRTSWTQIGDQLPGKKINALFVAGNRIFAGVYREGIFEYEESSRGWLSLNHDLQDKNVQAISQMEGGHLLIGTDAGIFQLKEEEKSWMPLFSNVQVLSLAEAAGKWIAGTSRGTLLSSDAGKNWEWIHEAGAIHYTHLVGDQIVEMYVSGHLFLSEDWGKQWTAVEYGPRAGSYVYEVIESGPYLLLSNNYGIHRSADKGKTWTHMFHTESMAFFDLLLFGEEIYGGTRSWDEYRKRNAD